MLKRLLLTLPCLLIAMSGAQAETFEAFGPVPARNQNPLALLSLDMRQQGSTVLPAHQMEVETDFAFSNLFERQANANTLYQEALDMEILRYSYLFRYGLLGHYELGFEIPFIHTSDGFLDPFIQWYHDLFGLPNAGRNLFPDNTFAYEISQNGQTVYRVSEQSYGLSDIVLNFKSEIMKESIYRPGLASIYYLKLPTGANSRGLGSGSPDFGIQLAAEKSYQRFHGYANLGYLVFGPNNKLGAIANPVLFRWMLAGEISLIRQYLSGIIQLDGDTGLFDGTQMYNMDEGALNLTVGFAGEPLKNHRWKLALAEDPYAADAAVDFTLWFQWAYRFGTSK